MCPLKIQFITHADFETPGVIWDWAARWGHETSIVKPYLGEKLSRAQSDCLIVMGGPQSPLNLEEAPYLRDEIEHIQSAISEKKRVFGFCLGAQLIGEALGARTERSPEKEIGIYPIELTEEGRKDPLFLDFPPRFDAIHWHSDMPGLTREAVILAQSEGCPRQVVRYAPGLYAFQCHLEITRAGIEDLIQACPDDLKSGRFIQSKDALRMNHYEPIHQKMFTLLDRLISLPLRR